MWTRSSDGELVGALFEAVAEPHLIQPTILYDFPVEISPLSKCNDDDPSTAERFEVFIGGFELGNAFSELNDPIEQERRFRCQVEQGGEEAPKEVDLDYIRALSHAMPPAAGMGIGIDRTDHAAHGFAFDPRRDSLPAACGPKRRLERETQRRPNLQIHGFQRPAQNHEI